MKKSLIEYLENIGRSYEMYPDKIPMKNPEGNFLGNEYLWE